MSNLEKIIKSKAGKFGLATLALGTTLVLTQAKNTESYERNTPAPYVIEEAAPASYTPVGNTLDYTMTEKGPIYNLPEVVVSDERKQAEQAVPASYTPVGNTLDYTMTEKGPIYQLPEVICIYNKATGKQEYGPIPEAEPELEQ